VRFSINPRVVYTVISALCIITGSFIAIRFAQGYRFSFSQQKSTVTSSGLLSANSFPEEAFVTVNGKRIGVTDNKFYLEPGSYEVEIAKDGYFPWKKTMALESELVAQTNARLFRIVPSLTPLTYTGIRNISPSPDGEKIIFYTASASAKNRNGLYVLDLTTTLLNSQREPRQISEEAAGFDLETAQFIWSPDNTQVILSTNDKDVLLDINQKNTLSVLPDIGFRKNEVLSSWEAELYIRERQQLSKFPLLIQEVASQSAMNVYLSPDKKKLLYTATASATLPPNLIPPILAASSQPEERTLQPGGTYVYDSTEDRNFRVDVIPTQLNYQEVATSATAARHSRILLADDLSGPAKSYTASPSSFRRLLASDSAEVASNFAKYYSSLYSHGIQWFPDSKHIMFTDGDRMYLMEYDNTNRTAVYSGPFDPMFIYPWPDGSRILTLTSLSSTSLPNLYAIELK
jgi:hypothetical protein